LNSDYKLNVTISQSFDSVLYKKMWLSQIEFNLIRYNDHFPLNFMDQMLKILTSKSHYYFLDG
jgi:hypothetical protein